LPIFEANQKNVYAVSIAREQRAAPEQLLEHLIVRGKLDVER
jgi:hypothetical protein